VVATNARSRQPAAPFAIESRQGVIALRGELRLTELSVIWRNLRAAAAARPGGSHLEIDLSDVTVVDGAVLALLVELRAGLAQRGVRTEIAGGSEPVRELVRLYHGYEPPRPKAPPPRRGPVEQVGDATRAFGRGAGRAVTFIGEMIAALRGVMTRPVAANWRPVPPLAARAGFDAVPIVLLLNTLVGMVMGYQSARQLERYGANVFVADVVGLSVIRELGPLVTAIIVAGRSGAAFAAELGTMKVSEEIDALRTMGFAPMRYLVLPRMAALFLVLPVLALFGDTVGVAGGAIVGATNLGVSARAYLIELRTAVVARDIIAGLIKSSVFGLAIGFISCQKGLLTSGGAAGVGRSATSTVVSCLVWIVIIDAVFAVILRVIG
jgi:phospholipid/cholesterol/gamma-HCH transport system permease protein